MKYLIPLILVIFLIRYLLKNKKKVTPVMKQEPEVLKQDPICGAYVSCQRDLSVRTEDGVEFFCSKTCMEKFKELKR